MFVITKYTYNSQGKMNDADPVAIFTTWDNALAELNSIAKDYENSSRDTVISWGTSSLQVEFLDGLKRQFWFEVARVEIKA